VPTNPDVALSTVSAPETRNRIAAIDPEVLSIVIASLVEVAVFLKIAMTAELPPSSATFVQPVLVVVTPVAPLTNNIRSSPTATVSALKGVQDEPTDPFE